MTFHKFHLIIVAITALNYAMMTFYSMPLLFGAAEGLWPFDLRIMGYSAQDAVAYGAAITDEGRQFYVTTQQRLDTFFPALLALTFMLTLYRLAPKFPALFLTPLAGALFDYYENAAVREILLSPNPDAGLVEMASLLTSLKFASIALSLLAILWLWQKAKLNGGSVPGQ